MNYRTNDLLPEVLTVRQDKAWVWQGGVLRVHVSTLNNTPATGLKQANSGVAVS